jgi:hypothetical protein
VEDSLVDTADAVDVLNGTDADVVDLDNGLNDTVQAGDVADGGVNVEDADVVDANGLAGEGVDASGADVIDSADALNPEVTDTLNDLDVLNGDAIDVGDADADLINGDVADASGDSLSGNDVDLFDGGIDIGEITVIDGDILDDGIPNDDALTDVVDGGLLPGETDIDVIEDGALSGDALNGDLLDGVVGLGSIANLDVLDGVAGNGLPIEDTDGLGLLDSDVLDGGILNDDVLSDVVEGGVPDDVDLLGDVTDGGLLDDEILNGVIDSNILEDVDLLDNVADGGLLDTDLLEDVDLIGGVVGDVLGDSLLPEDLIQVDEDSLDELLPEVVGNPIEGDSSDPDTAGGADTSTPPNNTTNNPGKATGEQHGRVEVGLTVPPTDLDDFVNRRVISRTNRSIVERYSDNRPDRADRVATSGGRVASFQAPQSGTANLAVKALPNAGAGHADASMPFSTYALASLALAVAGAGVRRLAGERRLN